MQDEPDGGALLREVVRELREGIPAGFRQKVAANAVALALREMEVAGPAHVEERERLCALLGRDDTLAALTRDLCARLRDGSIDRHAADLHAHLRATAVAKLMVDQPSYPPFAAHCRKD